jgi:hypothetical protein
MGQIQNEETKGVTVAAGQTHTLSTRPRSGIAVVHPDVERTIAIDRDQPVALGGALTDIIDVAVGGIGALIR